MTGNVAVSPTESDTRPPEAILATPRKASAWKKLWDQPTDQKLLIEGSDTFPDIHQRQRHLTSVILEAAIVLHVYEKLKEGKSLESLHRCFAGTIPDEMIEKLKGPPNEKDLSTIERAKLNSVRMETLVKMSGEGLLINSDMLVKPQVLDTKAGVAAEYDRALYNRTKKFENADASKWVPWMGRPSDPRLVAVQNLPEFVVKLFDPGPKSIASIEGKKAKKNYTVGELADLNRFGLMQQSPEYRDDNNTIFALLFPPKKVTFSKEKFNKLRPECFQNSKEAKGPVDVLIPQIFIEPPQVLSHGYAAQHTFVAIDRSKDADDNMLTGAGTLATLAEIKNFSGTTQMAEEKTAILKSLEKALKDPSLYMNKAMLDRRKELGKSYSAAAALFETARKQLSPEEKKHLSFPPFFSWDFENPDRYDTLGKQLADLSERLPEHIKGNNKLIEALNTLQESLTDPDLYLTRKLEERRAAFKKGYDEIRTKYHARLAPAELRDKDFLLPEIERFNLENESEYEKLRSKIEKVQRRINIDAVTMDTKDWREEYIERALMQREVASSGTKYRSDGKMRKKGKGGDISTITDKDPASDFLPDRDLEQVAKGRVETDQHSRASHPDSLKLDEIKRHVAAQITASMRERANSGGVSI